MTGLNIHAKQMVKKTIVQWHNLDGWDPIPPPHYDLETYTIVF